MCGLFVLRNMCLLLCFFVTLEVSYLRDGTKKDEILFSFSRPSETIYLNSTQEKDIPTGA
jgi:hypothetical protein